MAKIKHWTQAACGVTTEQRYDQRDRCKWDVINTLPGNDFRMNRSSVRRPASDAIAIRGAEQAEWMGRTAGFREEELVGLRALMCEITPPRLQEWPGGDAKRAMTCSPAFLDPSQLSSSLTASSLINLVQQDLCVIRLTQAAHLQSLLPQLSREKIME